MKIALDPAMLHARPVEDSLTAAAEAGYQYVEFGNRNDLIPAFGPLHTPTRYLRRIRDTATAAAVQIVSVAVIQSWSNPDQAARARAVAWWKEGIAAALELGCRRINTEFSGDPNDVDALRPAIPATSHKGPRATRTRMSTSDWTP